MPSFVGKTKGKGRQFCGYSLQIHCVNPEFNARPNTPVPMPNRPMPDRPKPNTPMPNMNGGNGNSRPDFSGDNSNAVPFLGKLNDPARINRENLSLPPQG